MAFLRRYSSASFLRLAKSRRELILFRDREQISMLGISLMIEMSSRSLPQRFRFLMLASLSVLQRV